MKLYIASSLLLALAIDQTVAFTSPAAKLSFHRVGVQRMTASHLYSLQTPEEQKVADNEIDRLRSMAQKLRAEAAALEAERAQELAQVAESAFRKFDTNQDGEISLEELKAGLEKAFKMELDDKRVQQLMEDFDVSGDGKLQLDEFVGVDKFRNKLEMLVREEKQMALDAKKTAKLEAEMAKLAEARLSLINEKEPTSTDKILSVLPYLFPLLDSLQFGRFLLVENSENPFVIILGLLYTLYRSIPLSGLVAYFALTFLSSNLNLNRLVRFNMQQAIFVDIALFIPGLLVAATGLLASGAGFELPTGVTELGSDVVFGAVLLTVAYASVSSALGITPNKIPFISQRVEDRMPTIDMFDESGKFIPREVRNEKKDGEKKDDKRD
jgi:HPt (histidine-containing phosphotransfer) domain-containing protein